MKMIVKSMKQDKNDSYNNVTVTLGSDMGTITIGFPLQHQKRILTNWHGQKKTRHEGEYILASVPLETQIPQAIEHVWNLLVVKMQEDFDEKKKRRERIKERQKGLKGGLNRVGPLIPC